MRDLSFPDVLALPDVTEQRLALLFRQAPVGMAMANLQAPDQGVLIDANQAFADLVGRPLAELPGMRVGDFTHPDDVNDSTEQLALLAAGEIEDFEVDKRYLHLDGTVRFAHLRVGAVRDGSGHPRYSIAVAVDVTERVEAEARRRGAEDLFRALFENSAVGMALMDLEGRCLEANHEMCRFLGRTHEEVLASTVENVTYHEDQVPVADQVEALVTFGQLHIERRFVRGDGQVVWGQLHATLLYDHEGTPCGVQSQIIDITEPRQANARLGAVLDSLAEGVVAVDGDGIIEKVNPAAARMLGYAEAELVGCSMHEKVHLHTGPAEQCAIRRVAGTGVAVRIDDDTFQRADGTLMPISCSAAPLGTGEERGVVIVFSDISERKARDQTLQLRLSALDRLEQTRLALRDDRFVIYTQPILDVRENKVVQEELLLRMLGVDGEIIPPCDFLPIAEEYGLIADIDHWVIDRAAMLAAQGRHVEVNISGKTLGHRDLTRWVEEALASSGADPKLMTFEITETALTADLEQACRFAEHVAALGCGFALDDFGTGYGSFTLLKRLPISYLKIDMEFVRGIVEDEADRHVVQAVLSLAKGLGMRTIAEGVEEQDTLDVLTEMGVDYAQGYLIGRPGPL